MLLRQPLPRSAHKNLRQFPVPYKTSSGSPRGRCNATGNLNGELFASILLNFHGFPENCSTASQTSLKKLTGLESEDFCCNRYVL
jgi:hypothetical protein